MRLCHAPRIEAHDLFKRKLNVPACVFRPLALQIASLSGSSVSEAHNRLGPAPRFPT
jgi:hypothetical protein